MRKILPIPDIPTKTYIFSASFGVVISNIPGAYTWQCLNYVKLYTSEINNLSSENQATVIGYTGISPFIGKRYQTDYEYEQIIKEQEKAISYIYNTIMSGKYIYSSIDEYYVPGLPPYNKYSYPHNYLIYGFDSDKHEIYILSYTKNRHYESLAVKEEILFNAIKESKCAENMFLECSPEPYDFELEINSLHTIIIEYLYTFTNATENIYRNTDIYEKLIEDIYFAHIDFRFFRLLFEHKHMLVHLAEKTLEKAPDLCIESELLELKNNERNADIIFKLVIKYSITNSEDVKKHIIERLRSLHNDEITILSSFADKLSLFCK